MGKSDKKLSSKLKKVEALIRKRQTESEEERLSETGMETWSDWFEGGDDAESQEWHREPNFDNPENLERMDKTHKNSNFF